ncbi:PilZ domain-containing protein [Cyanobium sp. Morenito 9A2]|uniref:PilZ domain-containing protein n=1 Tax=Cyanobium sp. Morenito 9A2 TaxID=2823718 RepID=UPI0020CB6F37|nr:PilZ domain-containing protein [Cyanobium sp. Morenito 9A2]MCP9848599.1 PilZ domain-containing protein [Cyanobium sp. Morenito 9A2]
MLPCRLVCGDWPEKHLSDRLPFQGMARLRLDDQEPWGTTSDASESGVHLLLNRGEILPPTGLGGQRILVEERLERPDQVLPQNQGTLAGAGGWP